MNKYLKFIRLIFLIITPIIVSIITTTYLPTNLGIFIIIFAFYNAFNEVLMYKQNQLLNENNKALEECIEFNNKILNDNKKITEICDEVLKIIKGEH